MFKRASVVWVAAAVVLACAQIFASLLLPNGYTLHVFSDALQTLLLLACYLTTLPNQVGGRGSSPAFWTLLSLGFALWLLNLVLWTFYEAVLHAPPASGFWGDVVLYLHVVPMMMALAVRPHLHQDDNPSLLNAANAGMVTVWWLYLYLYFVTPWRTLAQLPSWWDQNYNVVYGAANIALAILAGIAVWKSAGKWRTLYTHFFGAASLYAVSSFMASVAIDRGDYYSGSLYDIPLILALAWYAGLGLVARDLRLASEQAVDLTSVRTSWGTPLAVAAVLSVPFVELREMFVRDTPATVVTYRSLLSVGTTLILFAFFLLRGKALRKVRLPQPEVAVQGPSSAEA
ncbi:MAG TPA: hypothetical protein VJN48_00220 [Terriglobales bacterium]|nr:hypothetical protein [Terriglobales bacterium]